MERKKVSSNDIFSIGYNSFSNILEIEFNSGGIYQYFEVPNNIYTSLMSASSHGKFFHRYIKNIYRYRKMN